MTSPSRQMVLLTGGHLHTPFAKTALNLIRYQPQEVVAVLDETHAGQTCQELLGWGGPIPILRSLKQVSSANTAVVGIAPPGGKLPEDIKQVLREAIQRRMTIVSGLHDFLLQDTEIAALAQLHGVKLVDLRHNTEREVAHRKGIDERCLRILTVGQDCNVGKMVVSLELTRALQQAGHKTKFIATGQTGILIEGDGCPIDAVVADFINGAAERLVLAHQHHDILLIEGQGSIVHPRYSAVTLGLLHGCVPDGLILCYEMGRSTVSGMPEVKLPPLAKLVHLYETMAQVAHPAKVIGIAMNSHRQPPDQVEAERQRLRQELGLPVCDVIRHGPTDLIEAVLNRKAALGK